MKLQLTVNESSVTCEVEPRLLLVELLREHLGLTGTHIGCDTTSCGACTVLLDSRPIKSCTVFAIQVDSQTVKTIEGITPDQGLTDVQQAFADEHGLQCGFCTPGFVMSVSALLDDNPQPTRGEIESALEGNLCRCTGYVNILRSVERAIALRGGADPEKVAGVSHAEPLARTRIDRGSGPTTHDDDFEVV